MPIRNCLLFLAAIACVVILPGGAWSQAYEGKTCQLPGNKDLKEQLAKGLIPKLETYEGNYALWASSFLAPSGKPPVRPKSDDFDEQEGYQMALVKWSCPYSPGKAQDGDSATAWVEGVAGNGEGEILVVQVNTRKAVEIWAGFGKSPALFEANARPRKVRLYVLQTMFLPVDAQVGAVYQDLTLLTSGEVELGDVNGYQPLAVPAHALRQVQSRSGELWPMGDSQYGRMTFLAIEILSVYPGTKYQDMAISEVRNAPTAKK